MTKNFTTLTSLLFFAHGLFGMKTMNTLNIKDLEKHFFEKKDEEIENILETATATEHTQLHKNLAESIYIEFPNNGEHPKLKKIGFAGGRFITRNPNKVDFSFDDKNNITIKIPELLQNYTPVPKNWEGIGKKKGDYPYSLQDTLKIELQRIAKEKNKPIEELTDDDIQKVFDEISPTAEIQNNEYIKFELQHGRKDTYYPCSDWKKPTILKATYHRNKGWYFECTASQSALYYAIIEKYRENNLPVEICKLKHTRDLFRYIPEQKRDSLLGMVNLPAIEHLRFFAKDNPIITGGLVLCSLGTAGVVIKKIWNRFK